MTSIVVPRIIYPEDNQSHTFIYEDRTIQTLHQGLLTIHRVSNSLLRYRQVISLNDPVMDSSYKGLIRYNQDQGILSIRFPSECDGVGRIRNTGGSRMVTYYRNTDTGYVKEIQIKPNTTLDVSRNKDIELIVYTDQRRDMIVSFDVYLIKKQTPLRASL